MGVEPASKRAVAFFDGQNLYHAVRHAFGYTFPNYDPVALATAVTAARSWSLTEVRFYTGVPDREDDPFWNQFWTTKLAGLGRRGVRVYSRSPVYRNKVVRLRDGTEQSRLVGEEKGIDVRLAIDIWTDWIRIDRATYDSCINPRDYRPKTTTGDSAGTP